MALPQRVAYGCPAPAKVNLFLHVTGRRADGYHELQSVFVPVDLCDTLDFEARADGLIERRGDLTGPAEADLAVRAAAALRAQAQAQGLAHAAQLGANIGVAKRIPVGAGLGGGSSDAATTLIALNRLWRLAYPRAALAALGARLGADVPFFLGSGPAFVEGAGERCTPLPLPPAWFVLVYPQVPVSTAEIFADPKLTRSTKPTTIAGFSAALSSTDGGAPAGWGDGLFGANDLEPVARAKVAAVDTALRALQASGAARMSGSGSAVFALCRSQAEAGRRAADLRERIPAGWPVWVVPGLEELPLAAWLP